MKTGIRTAFIHDLEGNGPFDIEEDTMLWFACPK
jgi:hypothetical protein